MKLSGREAEVLTLIRKGKSRKETAEALGIAVRTVAFHRERIYRKLHLPKFGGRADTQRIDRQGAWAS